MRLRLETDEAYCGSLQEMLDITKDHLELLGLHYPEWKSIPEPKPMTREEYLALIQKRKGSTNE